jgi:Holliday junction resolvase RusA-like endonuclease
MPAFAFTVLGKPGAKARPRFSRKSGAAYTPSQTVNLEALIAMQASEARGHHDPLQGPVRVTVEAVFEPAASWSKNKRHGALAGFLRPISRPDADNIAKAVTDACNTILYRDDSQIVELIARKRFGLTACTKVIVEPAL